MKMSEDDFVREERDPFKGGVAICIRATDELVLAIGVADETGATELADEPGAEALRYQVG